MARPEINRSGEMEVFVAVADHGGFAAAARAIGLTPSAVSKLVARLEGRIGARLVNRTTRRLQLTDEGGDFYERSRAVLADIAEAERLAGAGKHAAGTVRVNTSASYLRHALAPVLPRFLDAHPDIRLEISATDAVVDLIAARADVAVRAGPLDDSALTARSLGTTALILVASPAYLARRGTPAVPADLAQHDRLDFAYRRRKPPWRLRVDGREVDAPAVTPRLRLSDGDSLRSLTLAGAGIARLAEFTVRDALSAGRLVRVLPAHDVGFTESFAAVFVGRSPTLPARARVLLDFLAKEARVDRSRP